MNSINLFLFCLLYFALASVAFGTKYIDLEPNEFLQPSASTLQYPNQMNVTVSGKLALCSHEEKGHILVDVAGGSPPYTYVWNNKQETQNRYDLLAGTYTVKIRDSAGIETTERIVIQPPFPLLVELMEVSPSHCGTSGSGAAKIQIKMVREGDYTIQWSHGLENKVEAKDLPAGNYSVMVSDKYNCSTTLTFDIKEANPIALEIQSSVDVNCESGDLQAFVWVDISGGTAPYSINWSTGDKDIKEISLKEGSEIEVVVNDSKGCEQKAKLRVELPSSDIAGRVEFQYRKLEITSEPEVYVDEMLVFESQISSDFIAWEWDFGDGSQGVDKDPVHVFSTSGTFEVTLRAFDLFGCSSVQSTTIAVKEHKDWLVLPNAFSPNKDGMNDHFKPLINGIADYKMDIFTKWGEHVYSAKGLEQEGWDGTSQGKESPQGTYMYKVSYETERGRFEQKAGSVTLVR